jgi:hypothetical protein
MHERLFYFYPLKNMTPYRQPPLMKIYLGHAVGTATLGALLPPGEHLQGLHAITQPLLQLIPGAMSISKLAPDPVFAQVFLALSLLIAGCMLIGAVWHVSRGGYHVKTFESKKEWWKAFLTVALFTFFVVAAFWGVSHGIDGAETRAHFLTKTAISSKLGVLTIMNQMIVSWPFAVIMGLTTMPFFTVVKHKTI